MQALNAASTGSASPVDPYAMPRLRPEYRGDSTQLAALAGWAKLSPSSTPHHPESGGQVLDPVPASCLFSIGCLASEARQAVGETLVGKDAPQCWHVVKPCIRLPPATPSGLSTCQHVGLPYPQAARRGRLNSLSSRRSVLALGCVCHNLTL